MNLLEFLTISGGCVYGVWWFPLVVIKRLSQSSLGGVGAGAELSNFLFPNFAAQSTRSLKFLCLSPHIIQSLEEENSIISAFYQ